eukprot:gene13462-19323_t
MACLFLPTYTWTDMFHGGQKNIAKDMVPVLQTLGLMPNSLEKYGRVHDYDMLASMLQAKGFTIEKVDGVGACSITADHFKRIVTHMVSKCSHSDDVLVIAFCGHGRCEPFTRHGSLIFSDNQSVSSVWLDDAISFTPGSVYTVLNCCMADGMPMAVPAGATYVPAYGTAAMDSLRIQQQLHQGPPMPKPRRVDIFSSHWSQYQIPTIGGTQLVKALTDILRRRPRVQIEDLQGHLTAYWEEADSCLTFHVTPPPVLAPIVYMPEGFQGGLFERLQQPPKVRRMRCLAPPGYFGDQWPGKWYDGCSE